MTKNKDKKSKDSKFELSPDGSVHFEGKEYFRKNPIRTSLHLPNLNLGYAVQWFARFHPTLRSRSHIIEAALIEYIKKHHKELKKEMPLELLETLDQKD